METQAGSRRPPAAEDVEFAERTANLLLNQMIAALLQVFSETDTDNVAEGSHSISLLFDDKTTTFRLVGNLDPLGKTGFPRDKFERTALDKAFQGETFTDVQRKRGRWFYRTSIPLANFDDSCSKCHTNFGPVDPSFNTGAMVLKVPIPNSGKNRGRRY